MNAFTTASAIRQILDCEELTDEQVIELERLSGSLEGYAEFIRDTAEVAEALIAARKARIDQLKAKNDADANRVERLKARLAEVMKVAGTDKIKTAFVSCWFQKTETVLVECEVDALPPDAVKRKEVVEVKADKEKLKKWFKAGAVLPDGVRIVTTETLRIQ